MPSPTIITGLRVVAAYYKGYWMETITTDKDGMNETHDVHCIGLEGWHAGCDDTITMYVKGGVKYIEPAQWDEQTPVDEKMEKAESLRAQNEKQKKRDADEKESMEKLAKKQNDADLKRQEDERKNKKML